MRRFAGGVAAVVILGVGAFPVAAAARDTVIPRTVEGSASVPGGGEGSLTLRCPRGSVALHAAAEELPRGVTLIESAPRSNARSWALRFAGRGGRSKRVEAVLRCVRLRLSRGMSQVTVAVSGSSRAMTVGANSSLRTAIACRPGYRPTGHGITVEDDSVSIAAVVPSRSGWTFLMENASSSAALVTARVRCLRRRASARQGGRRVRFSWDISRSGWTHTVRGGGRRTYSNSCARGNYSVSTGVSLDPDGRIALRSASPTGDRKARWLFRNRGRSERVKSYLLCLDRGTRFD